LFSDSTVLKRRTVLSVNKDSTIRKQEQYCQ
jgi:hypothetical protein